VKKTYSLAKRKQKEKELGVEVKKSSAGLGLYTLTPRKKHEEIIEYTGERIDEAEADRRGGSYLFTVEKDLYIDGVGRENIARYINHSCRPNCYAEIDEDEQKVHIKAQRAIKPGEELTYNYGKDFFNDHIKPYGCRCPKCSESQSEGQK
jgi:SET domain-containing protein